MRFVQSQENLLTIIRQSRVSSAVIWAIALSETFQVIGKRFTYGGDTAKDQRVYYINTKEMGEILYGTATPVPFRVIVNEELGYKLSVDIRCNGNFTYRICDPLLFYTNVCGNVEQRL